MILLMTLWPCAHILYVDKAKPKWKQLYFKPRGGDISSKCENIEMAHYWKWPNNKNDGEV